MCSPLPIDAVLSYPDAISQVRASEDSVYWLATIAAEDGRTTIRRLRGTVVEDLTPEASVRSRAMEYGGGAYSVDGDCIAFCDDRDGRVWLLSGDQLRPLTPAGSSFVFGGLVTNVSAGVILAIREDHGAAPEPRTEIVALSMSGTNDDGGAVLVTGADFYASLACDGVRLAWQQWSHPHMSWDTSEVWSAPLADPSQASAIAASAEVSAQYPLWLPSGRLAYVTDESGFWNWQVHEGPTWSIERDCAPPLWVLNPVPAAALVGDRIASVQYADGAGTLAVWSPDAGTTQFPVAGSADIDSVAASDSSIFAIVEFADRHASLVAIDQAGTVTTLVSGASLTYTPVEGQPIWAEGAAGRVHSWLYLPHATSLPPLIVMTHGGPTSMASAALDTTVQFWVSRGFAVLDVNYSGSTGFGRAYRNRLRENWGILDVSDAVAAVEAVCDAGLADPARVAITGGSAGGYTTLRSLTATDRYAAGISRYGIGDLTTLITDTHKAESRYPEGLIAPWPSGRAVYEERSPINHLDRLHTPMLILQGTLDRVVPPNQAVEMAEAVRAAGQPLALIMLEGEGHGFRAMSTRRRALEAQVSFLEQIFSMPASRDVPPLEIENFPV